MRATISQIIAHWRKDTLVRAIFNRTRKKLGIGSHTAPKQRTKLRLTSNAYLRPLCCHVTGSVLSVGEGNGADKEGSRYCDYFQACDSYIRLEYDKAWGGENPAEIYGDVRSMPQIADASFDCVFSIYVLEHIDDVDAAVAEIWRVLKPGGLFIFGLPLDFEYHGGPLDFWRFSEAGTRQLLSRFTINPMLPCGEDHPFTIDERLKFYGPQVQSGPLGYIGAAIKTAA